MDITFWQTLIGRTPYRNAAGPLVRIRRANWRVESKQYGKQSLDENDGTGKDRHFLQKEELFVSLFMTILSQSFLALVRRYFMTLPFFTTRHTLIIFFNCFLKNQFRIYFLSSLILFSTSFFTSSILINGKLFWYH